MSDPINPAHYAGRACADIGERLTGNGYQVLKYTWRLGKKDAVPIELGKALWYAKSEIELMRQIDTRFPGIKTQPMAHDLDDPVSFLLTRIEGQPLFTREIAFHLWKGYNLAEVEHIADMVEIERLRYAGS